MASPLTILKSVLNVNKNHIHVESIDYDESTLYKYDEVHTVHEIVAHVRPCKRLQCLCPKCGKVCPGYDHKIPEGEEVRWRAPNFNGVPVYFAYRPARIHCPEHGVLREAIPWQDGETHFTEDFNNEVAWLSQCMTKSDVAMYMGISWPTVGNCIGAVENRLEPDPRARLKDLRRICVDETSYKKGHKYITVVFDMDRNQVVWVHPDHGYDIFKEFCQSLTEKEREKIEVVAGDGAKWINSCKDEFFPNAVRCMDFFHVVQWANKALDDVRIQTAAKATRAYNKQKEEYESACRKQKERIQSAEKELHEVEQELQTMPVRGRRSKRKIELLARQRELQDLVSALRGEPFSLESLSVEEKEHLDELGHRAKDIKGAKHALGHAPENRTQNQDAMIQLIESQYPDLYRAFQLKEQLRIILKMKDPELASSKLETWMEEASSSDLKPMRDLAAKVKRNEEYILNAIKQQANSAKSEATNTTIKALIRIGRGFRNIKNLMAMIYLRCSDLVIPLNNRPQPSSEYLAEKRRQAAERRRQREEERRMASSVA